MIYKKISDIRQEFARKFLQGEIITNDTGSLSGSDTIELIGASFIADEESIFGDPNYEYIKREIDWYVSRSLNVNDIPGGPPAIWKDVSSSNGYINSNYGFLVFDEKNGSQFLNVVNTLVSSPSSRRATMIYTRPTMHSDYNTDGMTDFCCTNAVQYIIRNNKLHVIVQMRSNDAWAGYRNDFAWQKYMQKHVLDLVNEQSNMCLSIGDIHWQVASLHIYSRQFYLLDHFIKSGEHHIDKKEYDVLYSK